MRLATLASVAAIVFAAATSTTSHAQVARYCNNNLVANSFYSSILSSGSGKPLEVEYHGVFQNMDSKRQKLAATVTRLTKIGDFQVTRPLDRFQLSSYEQNNVVLFRLVLNNPGTTRPPNTANIAKELRITCSLIPN